MFYLIAVKLNKLVKRGGAGGSRTLVQTRNRRAFYMLSPVLIVGRNLAPDCRVAP